MDFNSLRNSIEILDARIRPIAERPLAFGRDLAERIAQLPDPLDEAGVRDEALHALNAAIEMYASCPDSEREAIRAMFREFHSFAWAARLPLPPHDADELRRHLIRFSILDQSRDPRDAVLALHALCSTSIDEAAVARIRAEVAAMSSDVDRFKFGSTKSWLLHGYGGYARYGAT